jgi:hypothetical protein
MRSSRDEQPLTRTSLPALAPDRVRLVLLVIVLAGLALAAWLRLAPIFADFAFGDGGLFWVMANDLRDNGFVPPDVTTYNTGDIPWVYPPIGIYLVALLGGGLDLFRFLPAAWAVATLPAFWLLAKALIGERGGLVALVAYGLAAPAYAGLIAGGGVTRGPGVLLALLTMWATVRGNAVGAGVFGGLTLLTHPIAASYTVLASGILWATRGARPRMLLAIPIALLIGAIWFTPMIVRHGIDPFLAGVGSRQLDLSENLVTLAAGALNPPNLAFSIGLVGAGLATWRRRWDLIAWLVVSVFGFAVVDRWMVIPLAVLAGYAVDAAIEQRRRLGAVALLGVAAATAVSGILLAPANETLTADQRALMAWAHSESPRGATFAVVGYPADRGMVEWFPALAERVNLTAWQGTEWLASGSRRVEATAWADCRVAACLPDADFYVVREGCCPDLDGALRNVRDGVRTQDP